MGHSTSIVTCHQCKAQSRREEKFYDISLHFSEEDSRRKGGGGSTRRVDLADMLQKHMEAEIMTGDNQFYCAACSEYTYCKHTRYRCSFCL